MLKVGILPYIYLILIYFLLSFTSYVSRNKIFFYLAILFVLIFVGFKDIMTPDFENYAIVFENIEDIRTGILEPSFTVISKILKILGFDYYALFFLYSFLTILFILLGIKELTNHQIFSFLLFLLVPGFFLNMFVQMRQTLSVAITFYSISLLLNKKKFWFLFALISIITHYSAGWFWLILTFAYKFLSRNPSFKFYAIILIFSFVAVAVFRFDIYTFKIFIVPLLKIIPFFQKYIYYVEQVLNEEIEQVSFQVFKNIFYIINNLFWIYIISKESKFGQKSHHDKISRDIKLLNLIFIGILILNISFYFAPISRLAYYFFIFQIVLIPNGISYIKQKELKFLSLYTFTMLYFLMFIKGLFYSLEGGQEYPFLNYKNILLQKIF